MAEYKLRKATNDDLWLSFEIRKNALGKYVEETWGWNEDWQREYHAKDFDISITQIIEADGKAVGTLEIIEEPGFIRITGIYVINTYQSKGIGGTIMKDIIKNNSSKQINLQVLKVNPRALEFYKRFGFKITGEEKHHYKMVYPPVKAKTEN